MYKYGELTVNAEGSHTLHHCAQVGAVSPEDGYQWYVWDKTESDL